MNSITAVLEGPVSGMTRIYALLLSITFLFEELPEGTAANDYVSGSFASLLIVPLVCLLLAALLDTACLLLGTPDLPIELIDEWLEEILEEYNSVKIAADAAKTSDRPQAAAVELTEERKKETTQDVDSESVDQASQQLLAALDYNGLTLDEGFTRLDEDGDGVLSFEELCSAFDALGLRASLRCIRALHSSMALQGKWVHRSSWLQVLSRKAALTPEWFRLSGLSGLGDGREIERREESGHSSLQTRPSRQQQLEASAGQNSPLVPKGSAPPGLESRATKKVRVQHAHTGADGASASHRSVKPLAYEAGRVRLSVDDYR